MIVKLTLAHRAALVAFALSVAFLTTWRLWPRTPEIVVELRRLPAVRNVLYAGPRDARLTIVHLLDHHFVPRDQCARAGIDFEANNRIVQAVQREQVAVLRYLIERHGIQAVHLEGLTDESQDAMRLRLYVLRTLGDDPAGADLRLEIGAAGELVLAGELANLLPLDDTKALAAAAPTFIDGETYFDRSALLAREKAMVDRLPGSGVAVLILGVSHDLGPLLAGAIYVRVTPKSLP